MTQAEFARMMNVSRAAVSQWKAKGILGEDAFTEPGKRGKILPSIACDQVAKNRDIGQSLGNGLNTGSARAPEMRAPEGAGGADVVVPSPLATPETPAAPMPAPEAPRAPTFEDQIKAAKLEEQLRKNRTQAAEELRQAGALMDAAEARQEMGRIAGLMLQVFEGALVTFSGRLAAEFSIPQRDVLHLLRNEFRAVRATAAEKEKAALGAMPERRAVNLEE